MLSAPKYDHCFKLFEQSKFAHVSLANCKILTAFYHSRMLQIIVHIEMKIFPLSLKLAFDIGAKFQTYFRIFILHLSSKSDAFEFKIFKYIIPKQNFLEITFSKSYCYIQSISFFTFRIDICYCLS